MQKLDIDMIYANMSGPIANTVGSDLNVKSIYSVNILAETLSWLDNYLPFYKDVNKTFTQNELAKILIEVLHKYVPKPKSDSFLDKITFNIFFNRALDIIVKFIVSKVFELIFVGNTLELNSKYVQNNLENND